jgi:FkbM family methyltransferase
LVASQIPAFAIDWEALLRLNYCILLDRGARFIDVGGNEGAHSHCFVEDMNASRLAIFEPIPEFVGRLTERFGGIDGVSIHPVALGNTNGEAAFQLKVGAMAESGLARKGEYSNRTDRDIIEMGVIVRRLDDVDLGFSPDFIKIDIEGGEIDMLAGAVQTIRWSRPVMSVEYGSIGYQAFGHTVSALPDWAAANGYVIFDLFGNRFDGDEFLRCVDRYYWDFMLIPSERADGLSDRLDIVRRLTKPLPMAAWRNTNLDVINRV